ncbi:MAG: response regulator [Sulfitobacter sp.]
MKILVVDDDPMVLEVLKHSLAHSGYDDVTVAQSAVEASQIIARASPAFECFLLDMSMPEIEGDDLCYWVRQLPQYASTPILMVTALANKRDIDRAFAAGASDYITKPIDMSDFGMRIQQIDRKNSQNAFKAPASISLLDKQDQEPDRTDFSKPVHLGEITGEVDLASLENYLLQLSRKGIEGLSAFAFTIADAAKFHFVCTTEEYLDILKSTGQIISDHLAASGFFLSYAGSGSFVGVGQNANLHHDEWEKTERSIQEALAKVAFPSSLGLPSKIQVFSGVPLRLNGKYAERSLDILYRTIVEAEDRCGDTSWAQV